MSIEKMSIKERFFHMILFELTLLTITTCVVVLISSHETERVAGVAVALSLVAMAWNFIYNWIFDQFATGRREARSVMLRVLHAVGFEGSLQALSLPIIAWGLQMKLWDAFWLNIGLTLMTVAYTFIFNWVYDHARLRWIKA